LEGSGQEIDTHMMRTLSSLRDFLDEEQLKWMPTNLKVESCILLRQNKTDENGVYKVVVQVFDHKGTWIGEVTNPDYIPE
jgi:predicted GH43/DUF377 family glycosyl hydrolase